MGKLKPLQLEVDELQTYINNHKVMYAYCSWTKRKMFLCSGQGTIEIEVDGVLVITFSIAEVQEAVEYFNNI